ncbi:MAG: hypothetical protein WC393_04865 [Candidatus Nanoarchaeia archaeon]|jgi:hypothetical protein
MEKNIKIIIITVLLIILFFVWAPWMNNQEIYDIVFQEKANTDGTIDKNTGELICDYNVMWFPFGRYVASCEGGYFVTFYGSITP